MRNDAYRLQRIAEVGNQLLSVMRSGVTAMTSMTRTAGRPRASTVAKETSRMARRKRRHQAASTSSGLGMTERLSPSPPAKAAMSSWKQ